MQVFKQVKIHAKPIGWCSESAHLEQTINDKLSQYQDHASMLLWQCRAEKVLKGQGYEKYYGYGWIGYYHSTHQCYVQIQKNCDKLILLIENEPILS